MRKTAVTPAGRPKGPCLSSAPWLLIFTGLSCITYPVQLPGVAEDAGPSSDTTSGAQASDTSFDQFSSGDKPWSNRPDECANPHLLGVHSTSVEMIIALDRSTSMQNEAFGSTTRWQAAKQAIVRSTGAHPSIQFDIEQFPTLRDYCGGQTCCAGLVWDQPFGPTGIDEQLACGSGDAGCLTTDDSPSHEALAKCREHFDGLGSRGNSSWFVLLLTDKDPSCGGDSPGGGWYCNQAVSEAFKLGKNFSVQTFIVALNSDGHSPDCLQNAAAANASYFTGGAEQLLVATNEDQLSQNLETIMNLAEVNVCRFSLWRAPDNPAQVSVTINQRSVPPDMANAEGGWRFSVTDPSEIVLSGSFCKDLRSAKGNSNPQVTDCQPSSPSPQ